MQQALRAVQQVLRAACSRRSARLAAPLLCSRSSTQHASPLPCPPNLDMHPCCLCTFFLAAADPPTPLQSVGRKAARGEEAEGSEEGEGGAVEWGDVIFDVLPVRAATWLQPLCNWLQPLCNWLQPLCNLASHRWM